MNIKSISSVFLFYVALTQAHGDHSNSKEPISGDAAQYAQRHVRVSHISLLDEKINPARWRRSTICTQALSTMLIETNPLRQRVIRPPKLLPNT